MMIPSIAILLLLTPVFGETPDVKAWYSVAPLPSFIAHPYPTRYPSFTATLTASFKPSASSSPSLKKTYSITYISLHSTRTINVRILKKITIPTATPSSTPKIHYSPSYTSTPSVQTHTRMLRDSSGEKEEKQPLSTTFLSILLPVLSAMCIVLLYMCANAKKSYVYLLSRGYSPCVLRFFKRRGFLRTQILPTIESSGVSQSTSYSQHSIKQRNSHESFDSPA